MALLKSVSFPPAGTAAGRPRQADSICRTLTAAAVLLALAGCQSNGSDKAADEDTAAPESAPAATDSGSTAPAVPDESAAAPPGSGIATGKPFVVIRFPNGGTEYEAELAAALREAAARKPGFAVDMAAVAPSAGSPEGLAASSALALNRADEVMQSLGTLGVPRDRINLVSYSSPDADVIEIRLYIR
jgi:outer membrane protein OmpA-like peptidoglycan-associated protein